MLRRLAVLVCALVAACAPEPPRANSPPPATPIVAPPLVPRPPPNGQLLAVGTPVERELRAGERHVYEVGLTRGQVLFATVDQRGVDVVVSVLDPKGTKLLTVDSPNGTRGPEPLLVTAKETGSYRIEVQPVDAPDYDAFAGAKSGRYEARVDEIVSGRDYEERLAKAAFASPRLFALWKAVRDEGKPAEERFWREIAGKAPIIEAIPDSPRDVLVSFVWHGDADAKYVGLLGGPGGVEKPLTHLERSDAWYLTARLPNDARFTYSFVHAPGPPPFDLMFSATTHRYGSVGAVEADPLNPTRFQEQSAVEMSEAPRQPWIEQKGAPHGSLAMETIASEKLHAPRRVGVYTPPGFDAKRGTYRLLVVFDGDIYGAGKSRITFVPVPTIVDNLLAAKKITPTVVALVSNIDGVRSKDLGLSPAFADFLADELVPLLRTKYRASRDPRAVTLAGSSLGGLEATYAALRHPEVFGNVLSQSGSFWFYPDAFERDGSYATEPGGFLRDIAIAPRRAVRFYLEAGRFDTSGERSILTFNRHLRDVLLAKGNAVTYAEFDGGHDYICWRGTFADGLIALGSP